MYGTVARMRIKSGYEAEFERIREEIGVGTVSWPSTLTRWIGTASALYEAHAGAGRRTRME